MAVAYELMQLMIIIHFQGHDSEPRQAVGRDTKGKTSVVLYLTGIACVWFGATSIRAATITTMACFVAAAVLWLVPARRIKHIIDAREVNK